MSSEMTSSLPKSLRQEEIVTRECLDLISTLPKEKGPDNKMSSEMTSSLPKYLQQEEIVTRECLDLISTLPKEKGPDNKMSSEMTSALPKYLQQEEIVTRECLDFISTLPKEKGWLTSHLYRYQGFWYPVRHLQGVISCQNHFQARDSDILLVTTPKSGTTWLKAVTFTLLNRKRFPVTKNHPLLHQNPHDVVPFLEIKLYADNKIPDLSSFPNPRIFATHLPYASLPGTLQKGSQCKLVYLCRSPKDIFVSLWQFTNNLKPQEAPSNSLADVFDMFCRGVSLFGPVWDHVLQYWNLSKEYPERVLFLKFEDMKEQPRMQLQRLAEFLGCPFSPGEEDQVEEILKMCSFDNLSSLEVNRNGKLSSGEENKTFFRRGVVGDWKNYLDHEMVERIDGITQGKFSSSGLKFECPNVKISKNQ